jgi:hypothetical protein
MKTAMVVTGSGPLLVSTTYGSLAEPGFVQALRDKGIARFIACKVSLDRCRRLYPRHFHPHQDDLRHEPCVDVLDLDGRRIFVNFPFTVSGTPPLVGHTAMAIPVTP